MLDAGFSEFKLDYPATMNITAGGLVTSREFVVGGHVWKMYCYPHGHKKNTAHNGEFLSLYLGLVRGSKKVKAIFEAFVICRNGKPSPVHGNRLVGVFRPPNGIRCSVDGWGNFMKRSDLGLDYVVDGWVTFVCGVIILHENSIIVPPSDIQNHLGSLLESTDGSDVSFCIKGEMFHAHRAVLAARSPVFRAELLGSMAEAQMPCITLHHIVPAAFDVLLQFMYMDALPGDDKLGDNPIDMFQHLLAAADHYALDRLKLICAQKLWENVSVDTVAGTLACAEMYNCLELKNKCINFVVAEKNFKNVVLTDGFMQLGQKFPSIIAVLKERIRT